MPGADLIAVSKTVTRSTGKSHQQTYWVKPEDVKKAKTFADKLKLVGGNGLRGAAMAAGWRDSSSEPQAISMRAGAMSVLMRNRVLPAAVEEIAEEREDIRQLAGEEGAQQFDRAVSNRANDSEVMAMSRVTAVYHDEPELTAYRGIGPRQTMEAQAQFDAGAQSVTLDVGVISSFSESLSVANRFANRNDQPGAVVRMRVQRGQILLSHRVPDSGLLASEEELVVYSRGAVTIRREDFARAGPNMFRAVS
jgi:hypothetical protein